MATAERWKGRSRLLSLLVVLALVVLPGLAPFLPQAARAAAQSGPLTFSTADAVPADAFAYIVASTDRDSAQWRLAQELLVRANVAEPLQGLLDSGLQWMQPQPVPLDALVGGEVAVVIKKEALWYLGDAVQYGNSQALTEGVVVVLRAGDPDAAWRYIHQSLNVSPIGAYLGTEVYWAGGGGALSVARAGQFILFTANQYNLEPFITTIDGWTSPISQLPEFTTAREALPQSSLLFSFIRRGIMYQASLGPLDPLSPLLGEEGYSAQTIAADPAGFRLESVTFPYDGQTFPPASLGSESRLASLAPANTLVLLSGSDLNATGALTIARSIYSNLSYRSMDDTAYVSGVSLDDEVFAQIEGEFGGWFALNSVRANPLEVEGDGLLMADVADPDQMHDVLLRLVLDRPETWSSGSVSVASVPVKGAPYFVANIGESVPPVLFSIEGNSVIAGTSAAIENVLEPPTQSLADSAWFRETMALLPAEQDGLLYIGVAPFIVTANYLGLFPGGYRLFGSYIDAFAAVSYREDGMYRTSAILTIGSESEAQATPAATPAP